MRGSFSFRLACVITGLLAHATHAAESTPPSATPHSASASAPSKTLLSMDGPGGRVSLGDTLEQAKKAFPPPKGAQILDASNYAIFGRPGWTWATEKPAQAFEVSLVDGKIVGIIRTVVMPDEKARKRLIEQTIQKVGKPTAQAAGKTASMFTWDAKPNGRFLLESKVGLMGSGPSVMAMIGAQDDFKIFNYRVDEPHLTVRQMDLADEALKEFRKNRERKKQQKAGN